MIAYDSGIYQNGFAPDKYIPSFSSDILTFPNSSFVISRDNDGQVLSTYGDDTWDLSPYQLTITGANKIHFRTWYSKANLNNEENVDCYKWLIFILIYLTPYSGHENAKSVGTIISYTIMIRHILKKISDKEYSLKDFIQSQELINSQIKHFTRKVIRIFPSLLSYLLILGKEKTGIAPLDKSFIYSLTHCVSNTQSTYEQTPVIPTKIYSSIINVLKNSLTPILANEKALTDFVERIQEDKAYARSPSSQRNFRTHAKIKQRGNYSTFFQEAVGEFGLQALFERYKVKSMANFPSFLKLIQNLVRLQIHIYSGMRRNEVLSLKFDCLKSDSSHGKSLYYLEGITTKLTKSKKICRWIIAPEAVSGIKLCQNLVSSIARANNFTDHKQFYLFTNVSHIAKASFKPAPESVSSFFINFDNNKLLKLFESEILIVETDLDELRMLCPERKWDDEERFQTGKPWPIANHQFRRSLAFYVAQSGLVSLPSLKQQLKHITNQMSLYYAKGSGIQLNFFMQNDKEHFIAELSKTKPVADALAFIKSILESNEPLDGAGGRYIERYTKPQTSIKERLVVREDMTKKFRNGEIAYSETPLGACLSSEPCNKKALRAVSACIDCEKAIIKPNKLNQVIDSMKDFVQKLEPSSIEHKFENEQLQDLKRIQRNIRERNE